MDVARQCFEANLFGMLELCQVNTQHSTAQQRTCTPYMSDHHGVIMCDMTSH
jgi:hypothetical protein